MSARVEVMSLEAVSTGRSNLDWEPGTGQEWLRRTGKSGPRLRKTSLLPWGSVGQESPRKNVVVTHRLQDGRSRDRKSGWVWKTESV